MLAELARELRELHGKLLRAPPSEKQQIKNNWYREMEEKHGRDGADYAYFILAMTEAREEWHVGEINIGQHQEVTKVDQSKHVGGNLTDFSQSAGGNQTGIVGGIANEVLMGDVTAYNTIVDREGSINAHNAQLANALKQGRQAIEGMKMETDEKQMLLRSYGDLTAEVAKPQPKPTILQMCWNTIGTVAAKAAPLVQLGMLLAQVFGITTHHSTPTGH